MVSVLHQKRLTNPDIDHLCVNSILNNRETLTETTIRQKEAHKDLCVLCLFVRRACYGPCFLDSCLTVELNPTERHHCWAAGSGISPVQLDSPQHSLPSGNPHHLQHHNSSSCINVAYSGSWRIRANETSSLDVFALKSSTSSSFSQHSYTSPSATQQRALRPAVTGPTS